MTRNERLTDHYLRVAGIAGVFVAPGAVGAVIGWIPVITIDCADGRSVFCCAHATAAAHLTRIVRGGLSAAADPAAAIAGLQEAAALEGVGLTPHAKVIERAAAAVAVVNEEFDRMKFNGGLRTLNSAFKTQRKHGGVAVYADYLHAKKAAMLEALVATKK